MRASRAAMRSSKVAAGEATSLKAFRCYQGPPIRPSSHSCAKAACQATCARAPAASPAPKITRMSFPDSVDALLRDGTVVWGFVAAVVIVLLLTPVVERLAHRI